eukprot:COSAG02_NODE_23067_length_731_cov_1.093354_1_plen_98_part_01
MDAAKLLPDGTKSIGGFRGDATSGSSWDFGASGTRSSDDKYTLGADAALLLAAQSTADAMVAVVGHEQAAGACHGHAEWISEPRLVRRAVLVPSLAGG